MIATIIVMVIVISANVAMIANILIGQQRINRIVFERLNRLDDRTKNAEE